MYKDENQGLGPIFDSEGNFNPERAQQEYLEQEQSRLMQEASESLGPIFDSEGNFNPERAQQEYLERERIAEQIVEQMASENYQPNEMELPGNILK